MVVNARCTRRYRRGGFGEGDLNPSCLSFISYLFLLFYLVLVLAQSLQKSERGCPGVSVDSATIALGLTCLGLYRRERFCRLNYGEQFSVDRIDLCGQPFLFRHCRPGSSGRRADIQEVGWDIVSFVRRLTKGRFDYEWLVLIRCLSICRGIRAV